MKKAFLTAVSGGSGSGKSTIVKMVQEACPTEILVISQDHYYRDQSHLSKEDRDRVNFDDPSSIDHELLREHLKMLLNGQSIQRPTYDFATHTRTKQTVTVAPKETIFLDGIFALVYEDIRNLVDLKIFLEVRDDLRFIRRLKRDIDQRGRTVQSVIEQYIKTVRPMHIQHIETTKRFADLVVFWEEINVQSVNMIVSLIQQYHSTHS